jgi:hypothetical protein
VEEGIKMSKEYRPITVMELIEDLQAYSALPDNGGINPKMWVVIENNKFLFEFPKEGFLAGNHNGGLSLKKEIEKTIEYTYHDAEIKKSEKKPEKVYGRYLIKGRDGLFEVYIIEWSESGYFFRASKTSDLTVFQWYDIFINSILERLSESK